MGHAAHVSCETFGMFVTVATWGGCAAMIAASTVKFVLVARSGAKAPATPEPLVAFIVLGAVMATIGGLAGGGSVQVIGVVAYRSSRCTRSAYAAARET